MSYLLIANILSFISACFTVASSWTKKPGRTYAYQVGQCLVYAAAAFFFGVYANILMMVISAFRNLLVATGKYSRTWMFALTVISLGVGLAINAGSIPGYINILATVSYTILSFYLKEAKAVKLNVAINLALWLASDVLIKDLPSGVVDSVSMILALVTIFRIRRDQNKKAVETSNLTAGEE